MKSKEPPSDLHITNTRASNKIDPSPQIVRRERRSYRYASMSKERCVVKTDAKV